MGIESGRGAIAAIDLSPGHLDVVQKLLQSHLAGVEIWAYGSRVKGNARRYSDLDLVAFITRDHAAQLNELRHAFEDSDLPFRVDLFAWEEIPESFHSQIRQSYMVIQHSDNGNAEMPEETDQ